MKVIHRIYHCFIYHCFVATLVYGRFVPGRRVLSVVCLLLVASSVDAQLSAPVLDNSGTMSLAGINEDETTPSGDTIASLIASAGGDRIIDADAGAIEGIAVIAVDNTNGAWEFSTNGGGSWTAFGSPSTAAARLLGADGANNMVRFVPTGDFSGSVDPGLTFHAWDQITGSNGNTADISGGGATGGITAYSTATETAGIAVAAINDAPVLASIEGSDLAYVEDDGATAITSTLTLTDVDDVNLESATIQITANYTNGEDGLAFVDQLGITGSFSASTGAITLSGTASVANYQTALRAVTYQNTNTGSPSTATRTLTISANDGNTDSNAQTRNITVSAVNDAPVHTVPATQTIAEEASLTFASVNGNLIGIAELDDGGSGLEVTLTITNGTATLNVTTGLAFSTGDGTADASMVFTGTLTNINNALDGMVFDPTIDFSGAASVQIVTDDQGNTGSGGALTDDDTISITVSAVNDPPVLASIEGSDITYTAGDPATQISAALQLTDIDDSTIESATVQITGNLDSAEDLLEYGSTGSITGTYASATGLLTLSGSVRLDDYQTALRAVTFRNSNSNNPSTSIRTVSFRAFDGDANSNTQTRDIVVVTVDPSESVAAAGLLGTTSVVPGTEVPLLAISVMAPGGETLSGMELILSDLSGVTGIAGTDFDALKLYRSSDASLDGATEIGSQKTVNIGSATTVAPSSTETLSAAATYYIVSAVLSSSAVLGRSFRVGFASGGFQTSGADIGTVVTADDANRVEIDGFLESAASSGVDDAQSGTGAVWGDLDNDGDLDLYVATDSGANRLYRNDGGQSFTDIASGSGADDRGSAGGVALGDYDRDGDLDLFVSNSGTVDRLYRNEGGGTFAERGSDAGVDDTSSGRGAAWVDYDLDGQLDLFVSNSGSADRLYHNESDGIFAELASAAGVSDTGAGEGAFWSDYDGDGDMDLYLVVDGTNRLYRNEGDGTFAELGSSAGVDDASSGRGAAWSDYDLDGDFDLFVSNSGTANRLYRNEGDGTFAELGSSAGVDDASSSRGAAWSDYDLDGDPDLFVANIGAADALYVNGGVSFTEAAAAAGIDDAGDGYEGAWSDYDGDGDPDLYLVADGANRLYQNSISGTRWLQVTLTGTASNESAVGAEVVVVSGSLRQTQSFGGGSGARSQSAQPLVFGLDAAATLDSLIVNWPLSGRWDTIGVATDQVLSLQEPGVSEAVAATGLSGEVELAPGAEELIFSMGVIGDGQTSVSELILTLEDHSTPTGLSNGDIESLSVYLSTDAKLSQNDDVVLVAQSNFEIGTATTLSFSPQIIPAETLNYFLVTAKISAAPTDGHSFRVGFAAGGLGTSRGGVGTPVVASDENRVRVEVVATRLIFSQTPADGAVVESGDEVVSGKAFATQPIVEPVDVLGNVDLDFAEKLTIGLAGGDGVLGGVVDKVVFNGQADYGGNGLFYTASADGEDFILAVDDEAGGTDLEAATLGLSADVVGTRLVFVRQPSSLLDPGVNFAPDSVVVEVRDEDGRIDSDYTAEVAIQALSAGESEVVIADLSATPAAEVIAAAGIATWSELKVETANLIQLKATSGNLISALSSIVAIPGALVVARADSLVAANALDGLAGQGGTQLVLNALKMEMIGERVPLLEVQVKPVFSGLDSDELRNIDLIFDTAADGRVDSSDHSVLAAAVDDLGSGVVLSLSVVDTLPADTLRNYLVVADLDHTVRSSDQLRVDVVGLGVGSGLAIGIAPAVPVSSSLGWDHVVSGSLQVVSVDLQRPQVGQSGKATILFDTVSDLDLGDEVVIEFPGGFDLSDASLGSESSAPGGVALVQSEESTDRVLVLRTAAAVQRGRYRLVVDNLRNPSTLADEVSLRVHTRREDGLVLDAIDLSAPALPLEGRGQIDLSSAMLDNGSVGQVGVVRLNITTDSILGLGDEIEVVFPPGFDLSSARVDSETRTPSGIDPLLVEEESSGEKLILEIQASEQAGELELVIEAVGFPASAGRELAIEVRTRDDGESALDLADPTPAIFDLPGRLSISDGSRVASALVGRAGRGGQRLVLAAFALEAAGDSIPVQAIDLLPRLPGSDGVLTRVALIRDGESADPDAAGESDLGMVELGALDAGKTQRIALLDETLAPGERRTYLVVGDLSAEIGSTDEVRVDIVGVAAGQGVLSGLVPVIDGVPLAGRRHVATGYIEERAVQFDQVKTGAMGSVVFSFSTASALAADDRLVLEFPDGFDLAQATLGPDSRAPSGAALIKDLAASTRRVLIVALAAAESAGIYSLEVAGVFNPAVAARDLSVTIHSERADGTLVDSPDSTPIIFTIVAERDPCRADFDGDGRIYFADLFLFGDAFGTEGGSLYDLDGDGRVDMDDFFAFGDLFGTRCETVAHDLVDETALPLEKVVDIADGVGLALVLVRSGTFEMGSPSGEEGRLDDEGPQRGIEIDQPFYLSQYELTQAQWEAVMGTRPWLDLPAVQDQADHPAVYISWEDALDFVQRLNAAAGDSLYRLPTEAEWEYAARAGTATRWSFGDDEGDLGDFAWTRRVPAVVSELVTHSVGSKLPNPWGFYDMHGSAAEWVQDYYGPYTTELQGPATGTERVLRGGGLTLSAAETRSAARASFVANARLSTFGLRIVQRIREID